MQKCADQDVCGRQQLAHAWEVQNEPSNSITPGGTAASIGRRTLTGYAVCPWSGADVAPALALAKALVGLPNGCIFSRCASCEAETTTHAMLFPFGRVDDQTICR
jgi:hypothetical protein